MYQENKKHYNYLKIILYIIVALLVLALSIKLILIIVKRQESKAPDKVLKTYLTEVENFANQYFDEEALPKDIGGNTKIWLSALSEEQQEKLSSTFKKQCNLNQSYIEAIRLDKEYQIKSYINCQEGEDYHNQFIPVSTPTLKPTTTKTTTSTKKSTKSTTKTTKTKKYTISFNSNGGSYIAPIKVNKDSRGVKPKDPQRAGYIFIGWYYHGQEFTFQEKINQDYILVAKWIKA